VLLNFAARLNWQLLIRFDKPPERHLRPRFLVSKYWTRYKQDASQRSWNSDKHHGLPSQYPIDVIRVGQLFHTCIRGIRSRRLKKKSLLFVTLSNDQTHHPNHVKHYSSRCTLFRRIPESFTYSSWLATVKMYLMEHQLVAIRPAPVQRHLPNPQGRHILMISLCWRSARCQLPGRCLWVDEGFAYPFCLLHLLFGGIGADHSGFFYWATQSTTGSYRFKLLQKAKILTLYLSHSLSLCLEEHVFNNVSPLERQKR
jgi:hypothetical protein